MTHQLWLAIEKDLGLGVLFLAFPFKVSFVGEPFLARSPLYISSNNPKPQLKFWPIALYNTYLIETF